MFRLELRAFDSKPSIRSIFPVSDDTRWDGCPWRIVARRTELIGIVHFSIGGHNLLIPVKGTLFGIEGVRRDMSKKKTSRIALSITLMICGGLTISLVLIIRESQTGHSRPCCGSNITFDLSRKGDEIAFSVPVAKGMDIYLLNIPSNKVSRLLTSEKYEWAPRFSSDGSKIAFSGGVPGERGDHIFLFDRKSGRTEQLTQGLDNDTWPSFYDNDRKIVFTRETKYRWGGLSSNWNEAGTVHALDLKSREIKVIYDKLPSVQSPQVLRSGFLFVNDFETIRLIDLKDKKEQVILTKSRDARLSFDENSIAFTDGGYEDDYAIHIKSLLGKSAKGLVKWGQGTYSNPLISPDGNTITFLQETNDQNTGHKRTLNRIDRDGENMIELLDYNRIESLATFDSAIYSR
jgi:Tol biopolymer transport system component